jgi:hypothetical protein
LFSIRVSFCWYVNREKEIIPCYSPHKFYENVAEYDPAAYLCYVKEKAIETFLDGIRKEPPPTQYTFGHWVHLVEIRESLEPEQPGYKDMPFLLCELGSRKENLDFQHCFKNQETLVCLYEVGRRPLSLKLSDMHIFLN